MKEEEKEEGGGRGGNKIPQNPHLPCLSNFLPTFPRYTRERGRLEVLLQEIKEQ